MKHLPMILALALSIGTSVSGQADGKVALCNEVQWLVEVDRDGDQQADGDSGWGEIYGGRNEIGLSQISGARWRVQLELRAPQSEYVPAVRCLQLQTESKEGVTVLAASARRPKVLLDWPLSRGWHHAVGTFDGRQVRLYLNGSTQLEAIDLPTPTRRASEEPGEVTRRLACASGLYRTRKLSLCCTR